MIKQLSNSNTHKSKILVIVFFVLVFTISIFFESLFKTKSNEPLILIILFVILYYFFAARFCTVYIDNKQLYFKGLFKKGTIPFDKLASVNTEFFSVNGIFRKSFPVVVRYKNDKGKLSRITFLSTEIGVLDEPEKIYAVKILREIIERHRH